MVEFYHHKSFGKVETSYAISEKKFYLKVKASAGVQRTNAAIH